MKELKYIMAENLKEFKEFYTEKIQTLAPKFAKQAVTESSKLITDFAIGK